MALGVAAVGFGLRAVPAELNAPANDFVNDRSRAEAHNSPSVAVHPRQQSTIAVANRLDAPGFACAVSVSNNGGATWRRLELPPGLADRNCFWPRVGFDADGQLLVLYTVLGGPNVLPVGVWLQRFDDLRAAGAAVPVAGDLAFHARLAVQGRSLLVSWVQAGPATAENQLGLAPGDNPIVVARSGDGGRTFSAPVRVSEGDRRVIQPTVLAGPEGLVVVGALDLGDDVADYQGTHDGETPPDERLRWRIVAWTSHDGGATFGPVSVVAGDLVVPQLIIADLGPTPGFARDDRRGRLYATWDAGRGERRDVFLAWSDDGGRRWSAPRVVGPRARSQLLPAVGVSPDGRVDVVLYDRSADPRDVLTETVLASSWDGGETFATATISDTAFDSRIGLGAPQGVPLLGDHLAVASLPGRAVAFWADTNRGTLRDDVQDLAVARVDTVPPRRRSAVAVTGAVVLAGAAGLAFVGLRRRRSYRQSDG